MTNKLVNSQEMFNKAVAFNSKLKATTKAVVNNKIYTVELLYRRNVKTQKGNKLKGVYFHFIQYFQLPHIKIGCEPN